MPFENNKKFKQIITDFKEDVFILGHKHKVWKLKFEDRYFINAGCSGSPVPGSYRNSYFEYVIMNISEQGIAFDTIRVPVDFMDFERYFSKNNYLKDNEV
jgi:predicted phosphodiesterase